jgi:hypothetical protein
MADIKFGTDQIQNPTPSKINLWVRVFTVVAGIFMGWMSTNNLIGPVSQGIISSILGLLLALVNGLAPLFGVEVSGNTVAAKDVTAVDSNKII